MKRNLIIALLVLSIILGVVWYSAISVPPWLIDLRRKLPVHRFQKYARRAISDIDMVVIHHTAGPEDQTPEEVALYHVGPGNHICSAGCPGIAYHIMIDRDANAYLVNDLENISYHASGTNAHSVGVCFFGNFEQLEPTPAQIRKLRIVLRWLNRKTRKQLQVVGHYKVSSTGTACPGRHIAAKIEDL